MDTEELATDVALDEELPTELTEEVEEKAEPNPVERIAMKAGWSPKDQWRGDPDEWKDAETFVEGTIAINKNQSKELKGLRESVADVGRVTSQLLKDQLAEKDAYWQGKLEEAVEAGDSKAVRHANEQINNLAKTIPASVPAETQSFVERNSTWFNKDPLATKRAIEIAQTYADAGYAPGEQVAKAELQIKKEFPELFPAPAKPQAAVATATARTVDTSGRKTGFNDMPKVHQDLARQLLDERGVPLDKYVETWIANNREKVG